MVRPDYPSETGEEVLHPRTPGSHKLSQSLQNQSPGTAARIVPGQCAATASLTMTVTEHVCPGRRVRSRHILTWDHLWICVHRGPEDVVERAQGWDCLGLDGFENPLKQENPDRSSRVYPEVGAVSAAVTQAPRFAHQERKERGGPLLLGGWTGFSLSLCF